MNDVIVGIDGGGSKTDAIAVTLAGEIVRRQRMGTISPHRMDLSPSIELIAELVDDVAGGAFPRAVGVYLSGLDLPRELSAYRSALLALGWPGKLLIDNDVFALLRAGTQEPDAVAVVCGTGMNAVGRRLDGATVRFPALGAISGDWGGGYGLGQEALWHAARDEDGRGPATALTAAVCAEYQVSSIAELIEVLHFGERAVDLSRLAPVVVAVADGDGDGDQVAAALVDRLADEVVIMAGTCLRRLDLTDRNVPVVLGGGILQAQPPRLMMRVRAGLTALAPNVRLVQLTTPPILGAAQLTLEAVGTTPEALALLAAQFDGERAGPGSHSW